MYKTPQDKAKELKKGKIKFSIFVFIGITLVVENFLHGYLLTGSIAGMNQYLSKNVISIWVPNDWRYFLVAGVISLVYLLYIAIVWTDPRVSMNPHDQKGSSKFLDSKSLKKFEDKELTRNVIVSENVKMSMNNRKIKRNGNIVAYGASGSGKTYNLISPNLLNLGKECIVVNDVKGEIIIMHGKHLISEGFDVRCLNTKDMSKSLRFNPMSYITKESDILSIAKILSETLSGGKSSNSDQFWDSAKENLITACIGYRWKNKDNEPENFNLPAINDLLRLAEERFDAKGNSMGSEFDFIMSKFAYENPTSLCARAYGNFKQSTDKTRSNIILTLQNMLSCLDIQEAREIFSGEDELKLWELATEEKIAIFLCSSDTDSTWNWITTLATSLGLNIISNIRDEHPEKGEDVVFWLDEMANGSRIKDCDKIVAVCRSRRIHMKIIIQSIVQLQKLYEKEWEAIIENCDTILSLGSQGKTAKWLSEALGKTGLDTTSSSKSMQAKGGSHSINHNIESRNLIEPSEIERLDKECIIKIRGEQPVIDLKYQTNLDKRFSLMGDVGKGRSDERNYFFDPAEYRKSKEININTTKIDQVEPKTLSIQETNATKAELNYLELKENIIEKVEETTEIIENSSDETEFSFDDM